MKHRNIIIFCCMMLQLSAFSADSLQVLKNRLMDSICTRTIIEPRVTAGGRSELYQWADSLSRLSTLEEKLQNFKTSNYTLKYYSYIAVLHESDSLGLILLKQNSKDTTELSYFQSCMLQEFKFNERIYDDYRLKLRYKYDSSLFLDPGSLLPLEYDLKDDNAELYRLKMMEIEDWWRRK